MNTEVEIRPGRRIHLAIYKSDPLQPTIFMIHGLGGRGEQWREQVKHLKNRYNLIVPDLLGQGASAQPWPGPALYSCEELNKDIQVLFENYASDKNYIFGHSYGGALATLLAQTKQARIQKLVLITPVTCKPFQAIPFAYSLPLPLLKFLRKSLDKTFEKLAFAPSADPSLLEEEKKARNRNPMQVIKALLQGMRAIPRLQLDQLNLATLIICGKLDKLIPLESVKAGYQHLPQHELQVLENAAHLVHLEKSEEVNRLLDAFLAAPLSSE